MISIYSEDQISWARGWLLNSNIDNNSWYINSIQYHRRIYVNWRESWREDDWLTVDSSQFERRRTHLIFSNWKLEVDPAEERYLKIIRICLVWETDIFQKITAILSSYILPWVGSIDDIVWVPQNEEYSFSVNLWSKKCWITFRFCVTQQM